MANLWSICIVFLLGFVCLIVGAICDYKKKGNHYVVETIFLIFFALGVAVVGFPYFQDLCEQETSTIVGEYVKHDSGRLSQWIYISSEEGEIELQRSVVIRPVAHFEKGKTYEIEYFNNSKVIKEYKLIE